MAVRAPSYHASASQWASASTHLDTRQAWRTYRVDGVRYVAVVSGTSGKVYPVRADAQGCGCPWYERTLEQCSHMLAVYLAATEDELRETALASDGECELIFAEAGTRLRGNGASSAYDRLYPAEQDGLLTATY